MNENASTLLFVISQNVHDMISFHGHFERSQTHERPTPYIFAVRCQDSYG